MLTRRSRITRPWESVNPPGVTGSPYGIGLGAPACERLGAHHAALVFSAHSPGAFHGRRQAVPPTVPHGRDPHAAVPIQVPPTMRELTRIPTHAHNPDLVTDGSMPSLPLLNHGRAQPYGFTGSNSKDAKLFPLP